MLAKGRKLLKVIASMKLKKEGLKEREVNAANVTVNVNIKTKEEEREEQRRRRRRRRRRRKGRKN